MSKSKSSTAFYKGAEVDVLSVSGGWSTIVKNDGSTAKVRNSELTSAPESAKRASKGDRKPPQPKPEKIKPREARPAEKARAEKAAEDGEQDARLVKPDLSRYIRHSDVRTGSGRQAVDIGDETADALRGLSLDEVYEKVCSTLGLDESDTRAAYAHLNPGMQRMNLGNRLRAFYKKQAA